VISTLLQFFQYGGLLPKWAGILHFMTLIENRRHGMIAMAVIDRLCRDQLKFP
jgi:hypothetical protein